MPVPTPHIAAKAGDIAKTVLMPGDPLRSKFIAETFLENPVLVNNVRGVQGYTGTWKGVPVTVMASGMGIPSIGIYSWELYNFYDDGSDGPDQWKKMGVLAIEMEAAGLYMNAARAGKRALGLFTISDHIYRAEELTSEQRQNSFVQMITIALDTAVNMANL